MSGGLGFIGASIPAWTSGIDYIRNRKEAGRARTFQYGMWNAENEYNLPINVRKRLEAGGYNPHMYAGGNITTASAPAPKGVDPVQSNLSEATRGIQPAIQSAMFQESQMGVMETQKDQNNAQTLKILADTEGKSLENKKVRELWETNVDAAKVALDNSKKAGTGLDADNTRKQTDNDYQVGLKMSEWDKLNADVAKIHSETARNNVETAIKNEEYKLRRRGLSPNDPLYARLIFQALQKLGLLKYFE